MNVITLASRKGGAGKSTLTAQLAAQARALGKRVLVIDADPQGSLKLWHSLRPEALPKLVTPERGIDRCAAGLDPSIRGLERAARDVLAVARQPARVDRTQVTVVHPAGGLEAEAVVGHLRDLATAHVAARQVFHLERGAQHARRRKQQVGANEHQLVAGPAAGE